LFIYTILIVYTVHIYIYKVEKGMIDVSKVSLVRTFKYLTQVNLDK